MLVLFRENLPRARAVHADMRGLELGETFDLILAWNSMFHLSVDDQRAMFATFAAHAHHRTTILFTTGPNAGEAFGNVEGETVYHASLDPEEYRGLLNENGFLTVDFVPNDPTCNGHTVWLAQYGRAS
jgi:hypothetical protein